MTHLIDISDVNLLLGRFMVLLIILSALSLTFTDLFPTPSSSFVMGILTGIVLSYIAIQLRFRTEATS